MIRTMAAMLAMLLTLPGATFQEDSKDEREKAREEAKKRDEDAKEALKAYRELKDKAKTPDDVIEAIQRLESAEPHPMIRSELARMLGGHPSIDVRIAAASAFGKFKKDKDACNILLNNALRQRDESIKKKCLQRYGSIAPYGMSKDLRRFFNDENTAIVREAIDAIETINSVRMIRPLVDLLGELESIKEDKGGDAGGGPPLPGVPQGDQGNNQRLKRKKDLTDPVRKAINALYRKYDSRAKLNSYTEANQQLQRNRAYLLKIQEKEDREDRGLPEPGAAETKD